MSIAVCLGGLKLKNPVLVASGTFGYTEEFKGFVDLNKIGAVISKTITLEPRQGNAPPRVVETPSGMLNSIGLENDGVKHFIVEKLPFLRKLKTQVIASIAGARAAEYAELAKRLDAAGVLAVELNLSCPNLKSHQSPVIPWRAQASHQKNNQLISQDKKATYGVVKAARKMTKGVIIAKLTPNVTDIAEIAKAAEDAGADSVSLVNTFLAMSIDVNSRRPKLGNITGGLSGPAIKPIALRMVWEAAQKVKIPVIGIGGIMTAEDALEFIIAGATAVEVGTANFINPRVSIEIIEGIKGYIRKHKISNIKNLIGSIEIQ
ncbi:MAG: dihydroorotate dehydrogenase [Candidatus Omnitrophota bacterium]|nr:dihydroorotate dehydrogenase [Candidatus Omnitrophota bacterium]